MNFKPVNFDSVKKVCPLPLAITVDKTNVKFRLLHTFVTECKAKRDDLFSLYYEPEENLFAIVPDQENKSGNAKRLLGSKLKANKHSMSITFPKVDIIKKTWTKEASITGIPLFEKRGIGKIVFRAPINK